MADIKLYAAPMEGLTTCWWRQAHRVLFGGADKYFTPFLSVIKTVPQFPQVHSRFLFFAASCR